MTCAFVITRIAPTPPALVILERSALHGVKDLRTAGVKNLMFVMQKHQGRRLVLAQILHYACAPFEDDGAGGA